MGMEQEPQELQGKDQEDQSEQGVEPKKEAH
jgi:hypothetical protein